MDCQELVRVIARLLSHLILHLVSYLTLHHFLSFTACTFRYYGWQADATSPRTQGLWTGAVRKLRHYMVWVALGTHGVDGFFL